MTYFLLYIWAFYLGFVLYAGCQNAIAQKAWAVLIPCAPVIIVAGLMDVMFNATFGTLMFWEWDHSFTFSERLDYHYLSLGWRGSLARDIGGVLDHILPGHIK
jgi:hypothetical protein